MRTIHKNYVRNDCDFDKGKADVQTVVKCKECDVSFRKLNHYREHLLKTHGIPTNKELHEFSSDEDFSVWKDSLEMEVGVNYIAHFGWYDTSDGKKNIFYCRRSGIFRPKVDDSNRKRAEKSQGSSKMGCYCTSSMEVVKTNNKVLVTLYPDHRDHDLDFTDQVHMKIPKSVKDKIAGMIMKGIEDERILEQVREASTGSRTSFIGKKDLRNICVEYGLNGNEYLRSEDSRDRLMSLMTQAMMTQEMKESDEVVNIKDSVKSSSGHHFSETHKKGRDMKVVEVDQGIFKVSSDTCKDKEYQVEACNLSCSTCRDRCPHCQVCKCMYVCSCEDNSRGTKDICRHIHAVVDFSLNNCQLGSPKSPPLEIGMIHEIVSNEVIVPQPNDYVEKIIDSVTQILVPAIREINDIEILKTLDSQLQEIINTAKAAIKYPENNEAPVDICTTNEPDTCTIKDPNICTTNKPDTCTTNTPNTCTTNKPNTYTCTNNEPVDKNCIQRDRPYATKKRTQDEDENTPKKPCVKAKLEISESLLKSQSYSTRRWIPILPKGAVSSDHSYQKQKNVERDCETK